MNGPAWQEQAFLCLYLLPQPLTPKIKEINLRATTPQYIYKVTNLKSNCYKHKGVWKPWWLQIPYSTSKQNWDRLAVYENMKWTEQIWIYHIMVGGMKADLIAFKRSKLSFMIASNALKTACGSSLSSTLFLFQNKSSALSPTLVMKSSKLEGNKSTFPYVLQIHVRKQGQQTS